MDAVQNETGVVDAYPWTGLWTGLKSYGSTMDGFLDYQNSSNGRVVALNWYAVGHK